MKNKLREVCTHCNRFRKKGEMKCLHCQNDVYVEVPKGIGQRTVLPNRFGKYEVPSEYAKSPEDHRRTGKPEPVYRFRVTFYGKGRRVFFTLESAIEELARLRELYPAYAYFNE